MDVGLLLPVPVRLRVLGDLGGGRGGLRDLCGEQFVGDQYHRAYASIGGNGVHRDPEPVAGGEHPGDGEPELRRNAQAGDADRRLGGEEGRGAVLLLLAHAETGVVDDQADARRHGLDVDLHRGAGGGVVGGVGEQLREDHGDRFDGPADDREVHLAVDPDPVEMADTALGAAGHVEDGGHGLAPAEPAAAEDGDALGAPPELAVGVVHGHQVGEDAGVVAVLALGLLDHDLLLVGEALKGTDGGLEDGFGLLLRVLADLGQLGGLPLEEPVVDDVELVPLPQELVPLGAQLGVAPAQFDVGRASPQDGTHGDQCYDNQRPDDGALWKCHETHFKCHGWKRLDTPSCGTRPGLVRHDRAPLREVPLRRWGRGIHSSRNAPIRHQPTGSKMILSSAAR